MQHEFEANGPIGPMGITSQDSRGSLLYFFKILPIILQKDSKIISNVDF